MINKKAFSYIRMSTEAQLKGHSLERQLVQTREYAKEHNFELIEDLRDIGISAHTGANVDKGKLGLFLKALAEGEIEQDCVLLVESFDRLSRKEPLDAFTMFSNILQHGVEIHTLADNQIYTLESVRNNSGQLFTSIGIMLRAWSESDEKSKRLKKKWSSKRTNINTHVYTSIAPAWLNVKPCKTGFNKVESSCATVSKIFEMCIDDNAGAYSITRQLNQSPEKFPPFSDKPDAKWHTSYIKKILSNPAVYGQFTPHEMKGGKRVPTNEVIKNYFPEVISEDRFYLAQSCIEQRKIKGGGRKGESFQNIFYKLLKCEYCGGNVHMVNKGTAEKPLRYIICYNSKLQNGCKSFHWSYKDFEQQFFKFVTDDSFEELLRFDENASTRKKLEDNLDSIQGKIKKHEATIKNLIRLVVDENRHSSTQIREEIDGIDEQIDLLKSEKQHCKDELNQLNLRDNSNARNELLKNIKSIEESLSPDAQTRYRKHINNILRRFIDYIGISYTYEEYDTSKTPFENLSPLTQNRMQQRGITENKQIRDMFFNTPDNKKWHEEERTFSVQFKNGKHKTIFPLDDWVLDQNFNVNQTH